MKQRDKVESKLPIAMVVGTAASLVILVLTQVPLKSSRPLHDSPKSLQSESVPAWLWQDPLEAALLHRKEAKNGTNDTLEAHLSHDSARSTFTLVARNTSPLPDQPWAPLAKDFLSLPRSPYSTEKARQEKTVVNVFLFLIDGAPHGSAHERRLRSRYAAISALGVACYVPKEQSAIQYLTWNHASQDMVIPYEWYFPSPMRRCSAKDANVQPPILVLWLNENALEDSVATIHQLRQNLQQSIEKTCHTQLKKQCAQLEYPSIRYGVLGPQSSDSLRSMLTHTSDSGPSKTDQTPIRLYSPNATIPFHLLANSVSRKNGVDIRCETELDCRAAITGILGNRHIDLAYSIGSDRELMTALVQELDRRDIKVGQHRIALLGEWDTLYGRSLPLEFKAVACHYAFAHVYLPEGLTVDQRTAVYKAREKHCSTIERAERSQILDYQQFLETRLNLPRTSYLAGLDGLAFANSGRATSNRNGKESQQSQGTGQEKSITFSIDYLERPEGESQLDYVRRIAAQLRETAEDDPYRAILILGSDVYDQLLILQALREEFPQALFLTTDLDARFWHADQLKWTRNLVIASHFGIELDQDLQRDIPPFRDSYQTSLFFAVLQATGFVQRLEKEDPSSPFKGTFQSHPERPFSANIPIRIHEIGRQGPVDLSVDCPRGSDCTSLPDTIHPDRDTPQERLLALAWRASFAILLAFVPLIIWEVATQRTARWKIGVIGLMTLLLCWIYGETAFYHLLSEGDEGEPLSVFDGVSIWPSVFIKLSTIILGLILFMKVRRVVGQAISTLREHYAPPTESHDSPPPHFSRELRSKLRDFLGRFDLSHSLTCTWLFWVISILAIALMPISITKVFFPDQQALLFVRPSRGQSVIHADVACTFPIILIILPLLNIYILSLSWQFRKFVELLKTTVPIPASTQLATRDILSYSQNSRLAVQQVARLSEAFYWLPFYPMWILILLIIGRSHLIDAWTISPPIYLTWMVHGILIASGAWMIRSSSESIHTYAIEHLKNLQWMLSDMRASRASTSNTQEASAPPLQHGQRHTLLAHVTRTIDDIVALRKGGLIGILEQPVVSTSLLVILALLQNFILSS